MLLLSSFYIFLTFQSLSGNLLSERNSEKATSDSNNFYWIIKHTGVILSAACHSYYNNYISICLGVLTNSCFIFLIIIIIIIIKSSLSLNVFLILNSNSSSYNST